MDQSKLQAVKDVIEKSTSKVSLRDLEKKGFRNVKVLRSQDIEILIRGAVESVLGRATDAIDAAQQEEAVREAKVQFEAAMREKQAALKRENELLGKQDELQSEKDMLVQRLEQVMAQQTQKQAEYDQLLSRVQQFTQEKNKEIEELRRAVQQARTETKVDPGLETRARELEAQLASARARADQAVAQQEQALARKTKEAEDLGQELRRVKGETQDQTDRLTRELRNAKDELERLRNRFQEGEAVSRSAQEEMNGLRQQLIEARAEAKVAQQSAGTDRLGRLEGMFATLMEEVKTRPAGSGGADAAVLKDELAKMSKDLSGKIARATGGMDEELAVQTAAASLEALFKHEEQKVESNIDDLKVDETKGKGVKSTLDRLKSLRKGGGEE